MSLLLLVFVLGDFFVLSLTHSLTSLSLSVFAQFQFLSQPAAEAHGSASRRRHLPPGPAGAPEEVP